LLCANEQHNRAAYSKVKEVAGKAIEDWSLEREGERENDARPQTRTQKPSWITPASSISREDDARPQMRTQSSGNFALCDEPSGGKYHMGVDSLRILRQNLKVARGFVPMNGEEMWELRPRCRRDAADGQFGLHKTAKLFDSPPGRGQHGFPSVRELAA